MGEKAISQSGEDACAQADAVADRLAEEEAGTGTLAETVATLARAPKDAQVGPREVADEIVNTLGGEATRSGMQKSVLVGAYAGARAGGREGALVGTVAGERVARVEGAGRSDALAGAIAWALAAIRAGARAGAEEGAEAGIAAGARASERVGVASGIRARVRPGGAEASQAASCEEIHVESHHMTHLEVGKGLKRF